MEEARLGIASLPIAAGSAEGTMVQEDVVREILARLERGERVKGIARELGVDKKTVKRWRRLGGWRAQRRRRRQALESFRDFLTRRGPEVGTAPPYHLRTPCDQGGTVRHAALPGCRTYTTVRVGLLDADPHANRP